MLLEVCANGVERRQLVWFNWAFVFWIDTRCPLIMSQPLLLLLGALVLCCKPTTAIPADPHFFEQKVDHFSADSRTYQQRYYINDTAFLGPGSPIFVIMGGEGGIEPSTGIFYPSIVLLAQRLGGFVVEPEHRFYGASQPLQPYSSQSLQLLNPAQALADAAALLTSLRQRLKCSGLDGEPRCPAVSVGGSYPGFLAAMMRIRYPNVVDMAYAASAPLRFYSQVQLECSARLLTSPQRS